MEPKLPQPKQSIIGALAASVAEKRQRLQQLGMMNVFGVDEIERARLSMEYSQAIAELTNAERDLRAAIRSKT